jgi:hypothetical protein
MDNFQKNVAKSKREVRIVIALIVFPPVLVLILAGIAHIQGDKKMIENYLEQERPNVVLALEAYKADTGHYPDSITDAVPHYYKGQQRQLQFLTWYEYTNFGTNFFLKDFDRSR